MHPRTAQFLLYHAKVKGVVMDVSALPNLTDYSDKKFQDAVLLQMEDTNMQQPFPTMVPPWLTASTQYFYTTLVFMLLQAEQPSSDSTRSIILPIHLKTHFTTLFHQCLLTFARAWEVYRKILDSADSNTRLFLTSYSIVVGQKCVFSATWCACSMHSFVRMNYFNKTWTYGRVHPPSLFGLIFGSRHRSAAGLHAAPGEKWDRKLSRDLQLLSHQGCSNLHPCICKPKGMRSMMILLTPIPFFCLCLHSWKWERRVKWELLH